MGPSNESTKKIQQRTLNNTGNIKRLYNVPPTTLYVSHRGHICTDFEENIQYEKEHAKAVLVRLKKMSMLR